MKIINARGRVLLHVTAAIRFPPMGHDAARTLYVYTGDRRGGRTTLEGLHATIAAIKADNKSAKVVGPLPEAQNYQEMDLHPISVPCPICPRGIFATVHPVGPPCLTCQTPLRVKGDRITEWFCPSCATFLPMENGL